MGKFFDGFSGNTRKCSCSSDDIDINIVDLSVELDDPEELLLHYFSEMEQCDSVEEAKQILSKVFAEGIHYGLKTGLINDIETSVYLLNELENGEAEDY